MNFSGQISVIMRGRLGLLLLFLLASVSAFFWANAGDPFIRIAFAIKSANGHRVTGRVVMPKTKAPCATVIYLQADGETVTGSGKQLRQFAEMGLAGVVIEYERANQAVFDDQLATLHQFLSEQPWARSMTTAWVGLGLGASRGMHFLMRHPNFAPRMFISVDSDWREAPKPDKPLPCSFVLIQMDADDTFSARRTRLMAEVLAASGMNVTLKRIQNVQPSSDEDRGLINRLIAEFCKSVLSPREPLVTASQNRVEHRSGYFVPVLLMTVVMGFNVCRRVYLSYRPATDSVSHRENAPISSRPRRHPAVVRGLRWCASALAIVSIVQITVRWGLPCLPINEQTLRLTLKWLVPPQEKKDFVCLSSNSFWQGESVRSLLEHVQLANYNRTLLKWDVSDPVYEDYVLSPLIVWSANEGATTAVRSDDFDSSTKQESEERAEGERWRAENNVGLPFDGRRLLWETFYPLTRMESDPASSAQVVIRLLRERVSLVTSLPRKPTIKVNWEAGMADERGFEHIYVAALRSVGIPARLNPNGQVDVWNYGWMLAPRPARIE